MGDHFKPLRRKFGLLTLVMACMFAAGWVKTMQTCDVFNIPLGNGNAVTIASGMGSIVCRFGWIGENPWAEFEWLDWDTARFTDEGPISEYLLDHPLPTEEGDVVDWYLIGCGFGIGESSSMDPYLRRCCYSIIPYLSIVISLTLISLWLLLSISRKSIQNKTLEPILVEEV